MKDYNKLTYKEATRDIERFMQDVAQYAPIFSGIDRNCDTDKYAAYQALSQQRRYFMKQSVSYGILDYGKGVNYMWNNTTDAELEQFVGTPHEPCLIIREPKNAPTTEEITEVEIKPRRRRTR